MSDLSQVSIGIKTFLRDELLWKTVFDIGLSMPEVQMIIADDGENTGEKQIRYRQLRHFGHTVIEMLFDSGFGSKSNRIAEVAKRPYLLIGSDDFNFGQDFVRDGIERMLNILESNPSLSVVSGRVNNRPYEFILTDLNGVVTEIPLSPEYCALEYWKSSRYLPCDLTVNYSLVRSNIFSKGIHWDDDVKIGGGEHGAFFVDLKRAGLDVGYVPGVNINEQDYRGHDRNPRYLNYRSRAHSPERPCFDKRGIRKYILGSGHVDYEARS
jgi:hypothetical protein